MKPGGPAEPHSYVGTELAIFERAVHWKAYLGDLLAAFLRGEVLEVGSGTGGSTRFLLNETVTGWCCLEPDPALSAETGRKIADGRLPSKCSCQSATVADLPEEPRFDAVVYIDVLEHIEDDAAELRDAAARLRPGGHLVVVGPAWPWLYTPFDAAIGHHRRYTHASLAALTPPKTIEVLGQYIDSAGLLASVGNRLLLRSAEPSEAQIRFWDGTLIPISRRLDGLLRRRVGKSVLIAFQKAYE